MMENFITWNMLTTYTSFVTIVFMTVEFSKNIKIIKKIKTKYWSFLVAFVLLIFVNLAVRTFHFLDLILYALSAMSVSLGANGLSEFNKKKGGE